MIKHFYMFMIWATEFELTVAYTVGGNKKYIQELETELCKWHRDLRLLEAQPW
jgi:hypothetical protein